MPPFLWVWFAALALGGSVALSPGTVVFSGALKAALCLLIYTLKRGCGLEKNSLL